MGQSGADRRGREWLFYRGIAQRVDDACGFQNRGDGRQCPGPARSTGTRARTADAKSL